MAKTARNLTPGPFPRREGEPLSEELTPREHEVLQLIAEGLPNKLIALKLGISEHTVKFHITSILGKLDAGSRTEAVRLGARRGLVVL
jgi:DNA-binding CsgD family transcriptional regulator